MLSHDISARYDQPIEDLYLRAVTTLSNIKKYILHHIFPRDTQLNKTALTFTVVDFHLYLYSQHLRSPILANKTHIFILLSLDLAL